MTENQNYLQMMYQQTNQLMNRVRLLEERYEQLSTKIRIVDQSGLKKNKEIKEMITEINGSIRQIRKKTKELGDAMQHLVIDMQDVAKTQDIKVLERYVNMFDPTRFLTKEEAVELIRKEMGRV